MRAARVINHLNTINKFEFKRNLFKKIVQHSVGRNKKPTTLLPAYMSFFPRFSGLSRHKTICFLTSKPRSVFSKFKVARIAFRELAVFIKLVGVKRACW
jgi:small subunit ribosomal protein S14